MTMNDLNCFNKLLFNSMKTIAVFHAYPKDASLGKVLGCLSRKYKVCFFIWDRQNDFQPQVKNEKFVYHHCRLNAGYYNLATLLRLVFLQAWLFFTPLFARFDVIHAMDADTGFLGLCVSRLRRKTFVYQCLDPSPHAAGRRFDTILISHVAEHLTCQEVVGLLETYPPFLRSDGRGVFITSQEKELRSDPTTHVTYMDFRLVATIVAEVGLTVERQYSFPFPCIMGLRRVAASSLKFFSLLFAGGCGQWLLRAAGLKKWAFFCRCQVPFYKAYLRQAWTGGRP